LINKQRLSKLNSRILGEPGHKRNNGFLHNQHYLSFINDVGQITYKFNYLF